MEKNSQQGFDIEIVSGQNNLEKHLLINGDEFLIPLADVSCALPSLILTLIGIGSRKRFTAMVLAIFKDLK